MSLWRGAALAQALGTAAAPDATGVSIDTRTLAPGDLFFAIQGVSSDGHAHVAAALAAGAAAAVVRQDFAGDEGPLLRVADTQAALETLARAARSRMTGSVAAVTGSVGKTGTKEMLRLMLAPAHASDKSYNNLWGVPLSLARMPEDAAFGVFEIGMNHAGEITPLTLLVRPHVALITTVEPVHLAAFADVAAIADAKAEIFAGLQPGGAAVLNADNPHFVQLTAAARAVSATVLSFGRAGRAGTLLHAAPEGGGQRVRAEVLGHAVDFRLRAAGEHLAMNAVAALVVVAALGADWRAAAGRLADVAAAPGRGARAIVAAAGGPFTLIDESYNANPASMRAAIAVLAAAPGRRIAVLGDMLELGDSAPALHAALGTAIDAAGIDSVYGCGPLTRYVVDLVAPARRGGWAETAEQLAPLVASGVGPGDTVMVKGSLGSRMASVVQALRALHAE